MRGRHSIGSRNFLLAGERKDDIKFDGSMPQAIDLEHASFIWEPMPSNERGTNKPPPPILNDIVPAKIGSCQEIPLDTGKSEETCASKLHMLSELTFSVGQNELLAVIGPVGSGKSSLLSSLAGDMRLVEGVARMGASRAYCPQQAWIQSTTIRNNILFGKEYEKEWYNRVVEACALRPDFNIFPAADETEVGERGVTLSGGQKQRIDLARAICSNADIILLDDPLSAVDTHVGNHIMDNAICGLLKGKCWIVATHQLHVPNRFDRIILMNNGSIDAIDTFENLMRESQIFQQLMFTITKEKDGQKQNLKGDDTTDKSQNENGFKKGHAN
jgi:ATP-binding cassette, subfamily C (CFTR/MRP), member 1